LKQMYMNIFYSTFFWHHLMLLGGGFTRKLLYPKILSSVNIVAR